MLNILISKSRGHYVKFQQKKKNKIAFDIEKYLKLVKTSKTPFWHIFLQIPTIILRREPEDVA